MLLIGQYDSPFVRRCAIAMPEKPAPMIASSTSSAGPRRVSVSVMSGVVVIVMPFGGWVASTLSYAAVTYTTVT